ncbi:hypothetical protein IWQ60_009100 [Tieghemiomyces parasiticus]|uniref:Argonaute-like protein n=1 Tax=Tieghemiomyces parasiticus TaxID=78921 RepID=A0A9W7ZU84_9FUNG|nr:hypothetical protein IWQ60_009100 [Tieghemiomyces parasiticus]
MATNVQFAPRPDVGTSGRKIDVEANFYEITDYLSGLVYQYDFQVAGKVPPALYRDIFRAVDKYHGPTLFNNARAVFDGRAQVYSPSRLTINDGEPFDVYLEEDYAHHQAAPPGKGPKPFQVTLKFATTINMQELRDYTDGRHKDLERVLPCLMALDLAFHHYPASQHVSAKNSFYTPSGSRPLSGGMEVWSGLFQSVRPVKGRLLLNVDVSSCVFYASGNLLDRAPQYLGLRRPEELQLGPHGQHYRSLKKAIKGVPITVPHRRDDRRYKIRDLSPEPADRTFFKLRKDDGTEQEMSVADYFRRTLNISLRYPHLPCVEVKRGVMLPLEVCTVAPGFRYTRKLSPTQTAEMIKFTCIKPPERFDRIRNNAPQLINFENPYLKAFGIRVNPRILVTPARNLPPPTVVYSQRDVSQNVMPRDGAWNMRGRRFLQPAELNSYAVLVLDRPHPNAMAAVRRGMDELFRACSQVGMRVTPDRPELVFYPGRGGFKQGLREAWVEGSQACGSKPDVVFVILPSADASTYGEIKRLSDTDMGAPTQCMLMSKVQRGGIQYMANVALKLNVKLRGVNAQLRREDIPFLSSEPTMVVGADVTHPEPGAHGQNSIAALVGTIDSSYARYTSRVDHQASHTEIIANMEIMFGELLDSFRANTNRLPKRIIFYRDGVSDSQFRTVLEFEVAAIRRACAAVGDEYAPPITFITCQKRHHVRFRPVRREDEERSRNCRAGTVVDSHVTNPAMFDFYLQAHSGLQGTSRPIYYTVLLDENGFSADRLQELTNRLCYTFPRCTRSVSLCTPAYMADVLAMRARYHRENSLFDDTSSQFSGGGGGVECPGDIVPFRPIPQRLHDTLFFM